MKTITVGISCIGSGVGQSVISSCRLSRLPLRTVGLGTNPFAFGAYDCDVMDYLPTIYQEGYVEAMIAKCREHGVDIVIPGLDDEALILSEAEAKFQAAGIQVLTAGPELIRVTRDKERMSRDLNPVADVFVRSFDRESIRRALASGEAAFPLIAKPRGGFASKGIMILLGEEDLARVGEQHIVQELAIPRADDPNHAEYMNQVRRRINPQIAEISIQLVNDRQGGWLGRMASYNKLNNGVPIEIIPYDNPDVWAVIERLYPTLRQLGLRGPLNIQGRLTEKGLRLFEMNPRFTGITGLRALMGFNEVETCLREWLGLATPVPRLHFNHAAFGCRQTSDKSIPLVRNARVAERHAFLNPRAKRERPVLLITGTTGFLGRHVARTAARQGRYCIWTLDRDKARARSVLKDCPDVQCLDHEDLARGDLPLGHVSVLIHCAFGRAAQGPEAVSGSLAFTQELISRATMHQAPAILNISSQAVYGTKRPPLWAESLPAAPETPYGMAKYAAELLVRDADVHNRQTCVTSLRLAALTGGQDGLDENDLLAKLVRRALDGQPIKVLGGQQRMTRLDVRDAVTAVLQLIEVPPTTWKPLYNVDTPERPAMLDLAREVIEVTARVAGTTKVGLEVEAQDAYPSFGMTTDRLAADAQWQARCVLSDTIASVVSYLAARRSRPHADAIPTPVPG